MGLDRRIVIRLTGESDRNEHGEDVPGSITEYPVWAERQSSGATDEETAEGTRLHSIVTWRVRWFTELAEHPIDLVAVLAEGAIFNAESISEGDARRRFLDIQAVRTSG